MFDRSHMVRARRPSLSEADLPDAFPPLHPETCPLLTHDKWSLAERASNAVAPPMKAYKLGKERWSYNQLKIEIHDTMRGYHLDPKLAKTIEPKKLPVKQQGYSAAFDMEFLNSSKLKIVFFICYSVPRKIATDSGPKYEWDLVTRDHCTKGCPGPILRPIQRLGKLGKRSNVPNAEAADPNQTKDPKFVYLSIDECGSHVGNRKTTFFRLVVGAYEATAEGENLLGTTCSEPFTVVRNNDNTEGASYSPIQIPVMPSWVGWDLGCVQMPDLARVRMPPASLPKSPGANTSPLSTNSIIPLYEPSWNAPARLDQLLSLSRHQLLPEGAHNGFTHLESSRLHHSSAAVVQTGAAPAGDAFPLPDQDLCPPDYASQAHSCRDCSSSGQRRWARWGGAARRTGRGRAHAGSPRARLEFEDSLAQYAEPLGRQDFLTHLGSHAQHMRFEHADAHAQTQQHECFGRMPPLAPQQSETAEEFRFMLPEQSQGPAHKRARIMAEDDSGLPFACLPGMRHHALTFSELPARPGDLASMPFVHAQLPGVDEAEPSPSQSAEASQAEAGQSGRLSPSAHAVDSDNYAVHSYQDADKEGNVESLQTMLSDPESLAPALALDLGLTPDQMSNSSGKRDASRGPGSARKVSVDVYCQAGVLSAEVLAVHPQYLLPAQYLCTESAEAPLLRTVSSMGNGQDSWAVSQSRTPSAGLDAISDFVPGRLGVQGQLSIQEEEFVDNILRQEPAADC